LYSKGEWWWTKICDQDLPFHHAISDCTAPVFVRFIIAGGGEDKDLFDIFTVSTLHKYSMKLGYLIIFSTINGNGAI
jgi:hypothetical protein